MGDPVVSRGRLDELLGRGRRVRESSPLDAGLVDECRYLRDLLGLSANRFAELVGVNPGTLWYWENGRGVRPDLAARYATAVGLLAERVAEDGLES